MFLLEEMVLNINNVHHEKHNIVGEVCSSLAMYHPELLLLGIHSSLGVNLNKFVL